MKSKLFSSTFCENKVLDFLDNQAIRKKLKGETVNHIFSQAMCSSAAVVNAILESKELQEKLYLSLESHDTLEKVLLQALKKKEKFVQKFFAFYNLKKLMFISMMYSEQGLTIARLLLDQHKACFDDEFVNYILEKVMRQQENVTMRPEVALEFLSYDVIRKKINDKTLSHVFMRAMCFFDKCDMCKNIIKRILCCDELRKKLLVSDVVLGEALKVLGQHLEGDNKSNQKKAKHSSSQVSLVDKQKTKKRSKKRKNKLSVKSTKKSKEKLTLQDLELFKKVEAGDEKKVKTIFEQHLNDLSTDGINKAFRRTVVGKKNKLRPKIALIFLKNQTIKHVLSRELLDRAFIKGINVCHLNISSTILKDDSLRGKLYTSEKTKKAFDRVLQTMERKKYYYLKEIALYPDLKSRIRIVEMIQKKTIKRTKKEQVKQKNQRIEDSGLFDVVKAKDTENAREILDAHLVEMIQKKIIKRPGKKQVKQKIQRIEDYGLFNAVKAKEKVRSIFDAHHNDLSEDAVSRAFIKSVTGARKKLKQEIGVLFLKDQEVREKLSDEALSEVLMKTSKLSFRDLFSKILHEESLRKRLYTNEEAKTFFEDTLKFTLYYKKSYLKEILSYPDLKRKIRHFEQLSEQQVEQDRVQPDEQSTENEEGFDEIFFSAMKPLLSDQAQAEQKGERASITPMTPMSPSVSIFPLTPLTPLSPLPSNMGSPFTQNDQADKKHAQTLMQAVEVKDIAYIHRVFQDDKKTLDQNEIKESFIKAVQGCSSNVVSALLTYKTVEVCLDEHVLGRVVILLNQALPEDENDDVCYDVQMIFYVIFKHEDLKSKVYMHACKKNLPKILAFFDGS